MILFSICVSNDKINLGCCCPINTHVIGPILINQIIQLLLILSQNKGQFNTFTSCFFCCYENVKESRRAATKMTHMKNITDNEELIVLMRLVRSLFKKSSAIVKKDGVTG